MRGRSVTNALARYGTFLVLFLGAPRLAHADPVDACIRSNADVQRLRGRGQLEEAATAARTCSVDACPRVVRDECARWASEIALSIPTIRILALDADNRPPDHVSAFLDGVARPDFATGKPLPMNPGKHVVRLEATGLHPVEQVFEVSPGDRDRVVSIRFDSAQVATTLFRPVPLLRSEAHREPAPVYVFGVIAGAGALAFAGLGAAGVADFENLKGSCSPGCPESRVSTDHTLLVGADIALAVALVASGAAVIAHFVGSRSPSPAVN
jgi:hypothetical protein